MKCVVCNSSDIEMKRVEEEIKYDKDILLIPLEVLACFSCGERYYDRKAMKKIEEMRARLKRHDLKVKEVGRVLEEQTA
jgi:YgiT-type zinc finger domain-containing protein